MDTKKEGKIVALIVGVVALALSLLQGVDFSVVGIYYGCSLSGRFAYHFFHANIFHAVLNVWCLLSVVFLYGITLPRLLFAYIVTSLFPVSLFPDALAPTIGLSAVVYFLFGSISFMVRRKWYYQCWMLAYLALGFLIPNANGWIHLYGYSAGLLLGFLNKPLTIKK